MNQSPVAPIPQPTINQTYPTGTKKISRRKVVKWLLISTAALIGFLLLVLIIFADWAEFQNSGVLLAGMILATVPVPLYAALVLWIDRFEYEPRYLLFLCFLWGGTVSIFVAMLINTTVMIAAGRNASIVISAPIVEEISKAVILFAIFFFKRDEFNGVLDGIVYAAITALGFAMVENFSYYGRAFAGAFETGPLGVFIVRGVQSPFLHPFFTAMTGIALGWAAQTRSKIIRGFVPLIGLGLAITFHALWNFSSVSGFSNIVYLVLMIPAFFTVLIIVGFALRREKQIICQQLSDEVKVGRLTQIEYEQLVSIHRRCMGAARAFFSRGFRGWRSQRRCNQAASELAFQRHRAAQGLPVKPELLKYCEGAFFEYLRETRA